MYDSVEWFNIFFAIFEIDHIAVDQIYFYELNSNKSATFAACAKVSIFKKSTQWDHANIMNFFS